MAVLDSELLRSIFASALSQLQSENPLVQIEQFTQQFVRYCVQYFQKLSPSSLKQLSEEDILSLLGLSELQTVSSQLSDMQKGLRSTRQLEMTAVANDGSLSSRQKAILSLLLSRKGRIVPFEEFYQALKLTPGKNPRNSTPVLYCTIRRMRVEKGYPILSVKGAGYMIPESADLTKIREQ